MSNAVLFLKNIVRTFMQGSETLTILNRLGLVVNAGEMVALVGPSGSGKTTLLQIAGLLDTPTAGEVMVAGSDMSKASDAKRTKTRLGHIGFVYQFHHLLPEFSAQENVMLPQMIAGKNERDAAAKATTLLEGLGLSTRLSHRPAKLSGGEQQRVAIARALANDPALILADEPTGNLDSHTAGDVFALLVRLAKERNVAALVATHNMELARRMDRTVTLQDGKLV